MDKTNLLLSKFKAKVTNGITSYKNWIRWHQ